MTDATARGGDAAAIDWKRIEGSEDFRDLVRRRHRFLTLATVAWFGGFLLYLVLATFATGFMGTQILGGIPIAFLAAVSQVLLTWGVTWSYLRKADGEFEPLERRVVERGAARFTREPGAGGAGDGRAAGTERSAR